MEECGPREVALGVGPFETGCRRVGAREKTLRRFEEVAALSMIGVRGAVEDPQLLAIVVGIARGQDWIRIRIWRPEVLGHGHGLTCAGDGFESRGRGDIQLCRRCIR